MGDFSLSSVIDLSLSLFPHTPVMRQTWRIVTAGNSSRIHKQTEKQPEMTSRTLRRSMQLSVGCAKKKLDLWQKYWLCDYDMGNSAQHLQGQHHLGAGHLAGGQSLCPAGMLFHLVQPWVVPAVGKSKRFIVASNRIPCGPQYIIIHLSFPPTCLLYESQTPPNIWWLLKTQEQLEEQTSRSKNRHPRQSSAQLLPH